MILQHAALFLFAWIFGNQVGVPVPVVPALLGAGALAGSGDLSMAVIIAVAVGASLGADLGAASALVWAGAWTGLGYLLSDAVTETAARLGIRLIVLFLAAFALYLPFQRLRRHRMIRVFRQARVDPSDLDGSVG